jgi:hypothetical protein
MKMLVFSSPLIFYSTPDALTYCDIYIILKLERSRVSRKNGWYIKDKNRVMERGNESKNFMNFIKT